ncbi:MAG: preprotein translocase subunit SecE [Candidatus Sungbacteria bacterium RIFCSPLOWO2_02_FULL_54_10]|uniref:Protein translocase subunit SecE n=2 Tax=Candidatus Sungiibacteriota TaxID=1817917 RepID=A0A1G2L7D1_9BACT|nr:MAG: preprotein translocase subunit SecE [Candidatus Sungbacteria bacterium RIFCSPHIGHO2_01_FULL_54_26]OHA03739.1 MAG: preprotein translocase subunit SecE [Candidatus Sungbacteria bacterium RIFCSPHIGHO2_02_FULL_53_17]OHA07587.1 MAG: preprotein translocase subunit SecE [Candidatus Sungbacteria bacterium RIFCSPLOWO2_01_FULL_54_21]OHA12423.1 MAG: preprotein translocase subunit SecE [Candidatus Sungbacteria bacterium RIFCSPLOWO2_02_FULL_54_10]
MPERIVTFFKESRVELKKVRWPTREETIRYTIAVIAASAVLAMYLGAIDYILQLILNTFVF